jgi:ADYC domain
MKAIGAALAAGVCMLSAVRAQATEPEHQQGTHWFGEGLDGYRFNAGNAQLVTFPPKTTLIGVTGTSYPLAASGAPATINLTLVGGCTPAGSTGTGAIEAYYCPAKANVRICGRSSGKTVPVVLLAGYWGNNSTYQPDRQSLTAGCSIQDNGSEKGKMDWAHKWTGALAKCVQLWQMNVGDGKRLTACIHMARAAYDGITSSTYAGTWVDAYDSDGSGPHQPGSTMPPIPPGVRTPDNLCDMFVEATWNENGAVCISHRRYEHANATVQDMFKVTMKPPSGADATDPILHCRAVADELKPVGSGLAPWPSLITNRSVHHNGPSMPALPKPTGDRQFWDDPDAVALCGP